MRKFCNISRPFRRGTAQCQVIPKHGARRNNWFHTGGAPHFSMKSTAAEIEAALANFRRVSGARNKRLLKVYVDAIRRAEFTDEEIRKEMSDEDWQEEQMRALCELVDTELEDLDIFTPTELPERFDRFAGTLCLDGTSDSNIYPDYRAERAAAYFDALDGALKEKAPEEIKEIVSALEDFRVLARQVLGILGPVLPDEMTKDIMSFWQDDGVWDNSKIPARVTRSEDLEHPWSIDRKIALLWDPGMVLEGEFRCLYVQESDGTWNWNFGWRSQGDERTFDNIPDLFEWYLQNLETEPPNLEGLTAEAVMNRAY